MATIGTILIQASNQAGNLSGGGQPSMPGAGGGDASRDKRAEDEMRKQLKTQTEQGEKAPKFWTAAFKKMGIQMGLSGILKQSQIFTSTVGSLFQLLGAFVDVILAPFVPMFIPAMRWLARQLPGVAKAAQWTADKISKGVGAAFGWIKKIFTTGFIKDMAVAVWENVSDAAKGVFDFFKDIGTNIKTHLIDPVWESIRGGLEKAWNGTLGGQKVGFGLGFNWTIPNWGTGGGSAAGPDVPTNTNSNTDKIVHAIDDLKTKVTGGDGSIGDMALAGGLVLGGGTLLNTATTSVKLGQSSKWANSRLGGRNPNLDMPKGWKGSRTGVGGWVDDVEMNPLRRIPGARIANVVTKPLAAVTKAPVNLAKNLFSMGAGDADDMAGALRSVNKPFVGQGFFGGVNDDMAAPSRAPRVGGYMDDLAGGGAKPSALSNAVAKFQKWVTKTGGGLKGAAGKGAAAFTNVYDEGLSLADDVVKLAGKTPGMSFVGQMVSVGFKRVIPGIAGAYMVGETVQDVWKIIKSDAPWLGDWKSLEAYKAEAMGALFGGKSSLLGGLTSGLGWAQSKLGFGDSISDWQKGIQENQKEKGVLSSGKLMDAIIRGTTGLGGAALSTFFPGLGTLAGTALYEGGRYATTGINVPGMGTVGGNVERYGEATDFSDSIIKAIEAGWNKGVNELGVR